MLLELLKDAFPVGTYIPKSFYDAKRRLCDLGLGYDSIHACKYDYVLFQKEFAKFQSCPVCGESQYKMDSGKGKKIPNKVLRHFPLIPRLKRLFLSKHIGFEMRWHKYKRVDIEDVLRHPADAAGWKHFDREFPHFASEPRNVRLGLTSDGFNPFGNMSTTYSMWPVVLIPYNLPPWKCMKESNFFMSFLVPGPKSPGKEIDVYLQPLIDELKKLWNSGSTKGYQACPTCKEDTSLFGIKGKISFMGHRRYLPSDHIWCRSRQHDGKPERRPPPIVMSGDEILEQINSINFPVLSKHPLKTNKKRKRTINWNKKSIFFELPYWSKLLLRHKLDVMHIEKNVCDNLLGTLLNIDGKTKDTIYARLDLEELNIRKDLHLQRQGTKLIKPHATYTLIGSERIDFCKFLKSAKFPDGFVSNISRCVRVNDGKL
ncbi:hypothetical protein IC582_007613 [Cucumis melo]